MHTLIFANRNPPDRATAVPWLASADLIVAADGGSRYALAIDVIPDVVVGDLDSLDDVTRKRLKHAGTRFITYPTRKDYTDLELAIRLALDRGATAITILGALGGRWDQSLANLMLLTLPILEHVSTRIVDRHLSISVIRDRAEITGRVGDTLSLIALKGDAHGVTIEGCEYPLTEAVLPLGASLGISNVLTQSQVTLRVTDGLVLVIHAGQTDKEQSHEIP
ncbi:MAG: thiamine diphosphokinase [Chloroflexi bacterium]|nr:thiamine diphosphokinase [Chloroflexota bacterium]